MRVLMRSTVADYFVAVVISLCNEGRAKAVTCPQLPIGQPKMGGTCE